MSVESREMRGRFRGRGMGGRLSCCWIVCRIEESDGPLFADREWDMRGDVAYALVPFVVNIEGEDVDAEGGLEGGGKNES